jgi:hypothetical protein
VKELQRGPEVFEEFKHEAGVIEEAKKMLKGGEGG